MRKIMLDTCIWQNFALVQMKESKNKAKMPIHLKKSQELWENLKRLVENKKICVLATEWNLLEFRDQITKTILEKKFIGYGYAVPEFSKAKEEIFLEKKDFELINDFVFIIPALCGEQKHDKQIDFDFLWKLCNSGISAFDAIHVQQANDNECDYFVTRDNDLIKKIEKHKLKVKVVHLNQFLRKTSKLNGK